MDSVPSRPYIEEFLQRRSASLSISSEHAEKKVPASGRCRESNNFASFPTEFQSSIEKLWNDQRVLSYGISHLSSLQKKQHDFQFRSTQEELEDQQELCLWTKKLSMMLSKLHKHLRALDLLIYQHANSPKKKLSVTKLRICKNVRLHVSLLIDDMRTQLENNQIDHLSFMSHRKAQQARKSFGQRGRTTLSESNYSTRSPSPGKIGKEEESSEHLLETYIDRGLNISEMSMLIEHEQITKQREKEMNAITKSISDLHDVFCDVQGLVVTQGTILDQIHYNLQQVNQHVQSGVDDLTKALSYQGTTKYKFIFLALFLLIISFLISTTIRLSSRKGR
ncbi:syntaxin-16-like protein [Perkinsela sp. CCAP 1560/4]|nr:syntaxin-16-like protein [Perkinsela sp. CCAP 1560/4]|eukprot:KNH05179.1 syntaxin-16-like protein [Perkinsela sp. CCAP 1560/4]